MRPLLLALLVCSHGAHALTINIEEQRVETCGNANGSVTVSAYGGQAPYTFDWTGPNGFVASGQIITDLVGGNYTVVVTDDLGATENSTINIESWTELPPSGGPSWGGADEVTGYWGGACQGQCNGAGAFVEGNVGGTGPFSYSFGVAATYLGYNNTVNGPVYGGFCHGEYVEYTYSDALGCSGTGNFIVYGVDDSWLPVIQEVQGECTGVANGFMTLETFSGFPQSWTLMLGGQVVATQYIQFGMHTFTDLVAGTYTLIDDFQDTQCSLQLEVIVPDLGPECGTLFGSSWYDVDGDCIRDAGEVGIPNSILAVEPGGYLALTHGDGSFQLNLPNGNYTLTQTDPTLVPICPAQPVPFTIASAPVTIELANGSTQVLDLRMHASSGAARPGFDHAMYATVRNLSPLPSGPVTTTIIYDPELIYSNATPPPTGVVGNVLTWEWPAFGSFESRSLQIHFNIPVSTPLGTVLSSTFTVTNTLPEVSLVNNSTTEQNTVTGSYDPNDKTARTSSRESDELYFINSDDYIDYTIRFQNTGTDTAFTVVITDTLSADYDMSSFQPGVCSHPCTVDFKVGRVVEWTFSDILLPDSNVNEAASHGLTSFRIKLNEPVLPGTVIENIANIFFDYNPPVITEPSVLVAEFSTGVDKLVPESLRIAPNPVSDLLYVTLPAGAKGAIIVHSSDGRVVDVPTRPTTSGVQLEVRGLANGLYVLQIQDRTVRFIKQ